MNKNFNYSLNYFNNYDRIVFKKNNSVLDVAMQILEKLEENPDVNANNVYELGENFIKFLYYLIVLDIVKGNSIPNKYGIQEKKVIKLILENDWSLQAIYNDINFKSIVKNYLLYSQPVNYEQEIEQEEDEIYNELENMLKDRKHLDYNLKLNIAEYFSYLFLNQLNKFFPLRNISGKIYLIYCQYYLIIIFILMKEELESDDEINLSDRKHSNLLSFILNMIKEYIRKESYETLFFEGISKFLDNYEYGFEFIKNLNDIIVNINILVSYGKFNSSAQNQSIISSLKNLIYGNKVSNLIQEFNEKLAELALEDAEVNDKRQFNSQKYNDIICKMFNDILFNLKNTYGRSYKFITREYLLDYGEDFLNDFFDYVDNDNLDLINLVVDFNDSGGYMLELLEEDYFLQFLNCWEYYDNNDIYFSGIQILNTFENLKFTMFINENIDYYMPREDRRNKNYNKFFNNFIQINEKLEYLENIHDAINLIDYIGGEHNIENFSLDNVDFIEVNNDTINLISGIFSFSSFSYENPDYLNIFFNGYNSEEDQINENTFEYYLSL